MSGSRKKFGKLRWKIKYAKSAIRADVANRRLGVIGQVHHGTTQIGCDHG